jgi:hypothetical protein
LTKINKSYLIVKVRREGETLGGQIDQGHTLGAQTRTKGSGVVENRTLVPGSMKVRLNHWGEDPY